MSTFNQQVGRLREELKLAQETPADGDQVQQWCRRTASLVMKALEEDDHAFHGNLTQLREGVSECGLGAASLIAPRPGSSVAAARKWWPSQLLLFVATWYANREGRNALARHLGIRFGNLEEAFEHIKASGDVTQWNTSQWARRLHEALHLLMGSDSGLPFELNGSVLRWGDDEVKLSPQQATFLRVLAASPGQAVTHEELQDAGVSNPVDTKRRMMESLGEVAPPFEIRGGKGTYTLAARRA